MMNEKEVRVRLDSWRFWISCAFGGIAILTIGMIYLVSVKFSQDADRRAQQKIANAAQVTTCIATARATPNVLKFLELIDVLASNSIAANESALKADPNGPLSEIRKESLRRLRPAIPTIKSFRESTLKSKRTINDCRILAKKLEVNIVPLLKESNA